MSAAHHCSPGPDADADPGRHADPDAGNRRRPRRHSDPDADADPIAGRRPLTLVVVWKWIDEDGDPGTTDDQDFAAGWEFNLDTDATITDSEPVTGDGEDGSAWFELELAQSTDATVGEDLQDGYELIDAYCINFGGLNEEPEAMSRIKAADDGSGRRRT